MYILNLILVFRLHLSSPLVTPRWSQQSVETALFYLPCLYFSYASLYLSSSPIPLPILSFSLSLTLTPATFLILPSRESPSQVRPIAHKRVINYLSVGHVFPPFYLSSSRLGHNSFSPLLPLSWSPYLPQGRCLHTRSYVNLAQHPDPTRCAQKPSGGRFQKLRGRLLATKSNQSECR